MQQEHSRTLQLHSEQFARSIMFGDEATQAAAAIRNRNVGCEIRIVVSSGANHLACGAFLNWLGFCLHC